MLATHDPRPNWDAKESEVDAVERDLAHYVKVAEGLHDPASIRLATDALNDLAKARAAYRGQRKVLDAAVAEQDSAESELVQARTAEAAGSLDCKVALKLRDDVDAIEGRIRHFGPIVTMHVASCAGLRTRVGAAASGNGDVRMVAEETRNLVRSLFDYTRIEGVIEYADTAGKRSNATLAAWWPIVEAVAIDEFPRLLAAAKAEHEDTGMRNPSSGQFVQDSRRAVRALPTRQDVERVFARRRAAFAAERRRVEAQIAALNGQLQDLGGAQ